jgi:hypothetical protein
MPDQAKPYLSDERLQDVVAAVQVMATNEERYSATCNSWAKIISRGTKKDATHWKKVFDEHGEFFRRTGGMGERYALVLRASKSFSKKFADEKVTLSEWEDMSGPEKSKYTRAPLADAELKLLIDTALALYGNTVERHEIWKAWLPPVFSFVGAFVSAILAFTAAALFKH